MFLMCFLSQKEGSVVVNCTLSVRVNRTSADQPPSAIVRTKLLFVARSLGVEASARACLVCTRSCCCVSVDPSVPTVESVERLGVA